jgi:hypothetical protein
MRKSQITDEALEEVRPVARRDGKVKSVVLCATNSQPAKKQVRFHRKRVCDPHQIQKGDVGLTAFNLPDVAPVQSCAVCQFFLRNR